MAMARVIWLMITERSSTSSTSALIQNVLIKYVNASDSFRAKFVISALFSVLLLQFGGLINQSADQYCIINAC
jgi:hypothetical protein